MTTEKTTEEEKKNKDELTGHVKAIRNAVAPPEVEPRVVASMFELNAVCSSKGARGAVNFLTTPQTPVSNPNAHFVITELVDSVFNQFIVGAIYKIEVKST